MNVITQVDPFLKTYELRKEPVTIRVTDFDETSASSLVEKLSKAQNTGQPIIPIIIDSWGGQIHALLTMIDAINASQVPIATIVQGKAMSAGAFLLSFGIRGHRYIAPSARVMIHGVSQMNFGKTEDTETSVREQRKLQDWLFCQLDANCGQTPGYFDALLSKRDRTDWYMGADEAIGHGLADHKRIPSLKLAISVHYEMV